MSNPMLRAAAVIAVLAVGGLTVLGIARSLPTVGTTPTPLPSGLPVATAPAATEVPVSPSPSLADGLFAPLGYDGSGTIAFTRVDPGSPGPGSWLIDPSGARESRLEPAMPETAPRMTLTGTGCCTVFSPDGRLVAGSFDTTHGSMPAAGLVLGLDGAYVQWAPGDCGGCGSVTEGISIRPTAWSLDSRSFASRVSNGGDPSRNGIYLSHLAGRGQSSIWDVQVTGAHDDVPIAFSPSGGQLLFVRTEGPGDNSGPLYLLGLSTGNVRQVSLEGVRVYTDGYFGGGASWSPDGSRIAWAGTDENGDANRMSVRVSAPDGTGVVTKSPTGAFITSAHWSPDGEWIAYDAPAPNGVHDLFVVDPDSETTRPLTEDFVPGVCCARWSPDSRALLVAGTEGDNDHSVLLAVPVDGSGIRQITSTPAFYTDFSWGLATR